MYTVTVPVKPYVKKFIFSRYQMRTWEIDKSDRIGKLVYNMLDRMPRRDAGKPPALGDELTIGISTRYFNLRGIYLSPESILDFNDYIKLELIEEVQEYIHKLRSGIGMKKYKQLFISLETVAGTCRRKAIVKPDIDQYFEIKEIIYDIFKQYDITEEDYPFDNIKKDIQRLKLPLLSA